MLEIDRRENRGCFGHGLAGGVLGVLGSRTVIEQHSRKETGASRFPEVSFQMEFAARYVKDLRRDGLRRLSRRLGDILIEKCKHVLLPLSDIGV
jgi:hypothetical protein